MSLLVVSYSHMQPVSPPSPTHSFSVMTLISVHDCHSLKLSFRQETLVSVPGFVLGMYIFFVQCNFTHDTSQVFWLSVVNVKYTKNINVTSNIVRLPCPLILFYYVLYSLNCHFIEMCYASVLSAPL